jgi:hypothetical protein
VLWLALPVMFKRRKCERLAGILRSRYDERKTNTEEVIMASKKKRVEPLVYEQLSLSGFRVEKGYYTTREVSELYHVSQHTVISWIHKGWVEASRLDGKKAPGVWRVHPQSIEDIDRMTEELLRANRGLLVRAYGKRKAGK